MTINEKLSKLKNQLSTNDWFFDVSISEQSKHITVLVYYMNYDVLTLIPTKLDDYNVLVHFANVPMPIKNDKTDHVVIIDEDESDEPDIDYLMYQLDKMEKICGANVLENVFFEIHDGKNAVTNLSTKFPEVKVVMQELYDTFGFDVVYGELQISLV